MTHKFLNKHDFISEILTLSDGGTILLDWYINPNVKTDSDSAIGKDSNNDAQYCRKNPLAIIVPGLTGDSTNLYSISTIKEASKQGYDAVVVNYRC